MFRHEFANVTGAEQESLLEVIRAEAGFPIPPSDRLRLEVCNPALIDFYPASVRLLAISDTSAPEPNRRYILFDQDPRGGDGPALAFFDWTNKPIYVFNHGRLDLDRRNVRNYVLFFFHFVRGTLGRFNIVESVDQINWSPEATDAHKARASSEMIPITYAGHLDEDFYTVKAAVVFKNAIFWTFVAVAPYNLSPDVYDRSIGFGDEKVELSAEQWGDEYFTVGQMKLLGEELRLEDQPIVIDGPPGEFG